jgi:AcrR family transcriptional regulator
MERKMEEIADLLEHELESAVEVKDPGSLKRFVRLLTEGAVGKPEYTREVTLLHNDIAALTEAMKRGFDEMKLRFEQVDKRFDDLIHQMDKRFEQVDKRFDDVNKRFVMMFSFMTVGFTILALLITFFD